VLRQLRRADGGDVEGLLHANKPQLKPDDAHDQPRDYRLHDDAQAGHHPRQRDLDDAGKHRHGENSG
jgi:hypothetical protein